MFYSHMQKHIFFTFFCLEYKEVCVCVHAYEQIHTHIDQSIYAYGKINAGAGLLLLICNTSKPLTTINV